MFIRTRSIDQAKLDHPGAFVYVRVKGGFLAFDYPSEYAAWKSGR
jgi:hypothetical protein